MTRQKSLTELTAAYLRGTWLGTSPWHAGTEGKAALVSEANTTAAEGGGKRGFQGPRWCNESDLTETSPRPKEPCLAAGQDFWKRQRVHHKPGWQLGADQGRFLCYLCIYSYILGRAQSCTEVTGLHSSEHVAHQHLARHCLAKDFSSHQLTALSFVFQQSWKF